MPGISVLVSKNNLSDKKTQLDGIFSKQNYLKGYSDKILFFKDNIVIGTNIYDEYPVKIFDINNLFIVLEGRIYNKTEKEIEKEITAIAQNIEKKNIKADLSSWLLKTDGDFLVYIINKVNNDIYIFNDIFGRLPVYYKQLETGEVVVSRYLNFITSLEKNANIDKIAIVQHLLLGYALGERTLIQGVNHLRSASLLSIKNCEVNFISIYTFNFQHRDHEGKSIKENIKNLSELFSEACKNRFQNNKLNIVTLSGGLDSRLVAACMYKNKIPFNVTTIRYSYGTIIQDEKVAVQLSDLFKVKYEVLELSPPIGDDVYTLLKIKEGMNSVATSQLLPFYRKIEKKYSKDINFITGDNGDKLIFTYNKPIKRFTNSDELAEYILTEHSLIDLETVSGFCEIQKNEILHEIKNVLNSFPEEELKQKYVHFRVMEKPHKYAFQGEDRHRHYFWTLSPFWSVPFYNYIMNCTDISKKKHKLFAGLIESFSPEALSLPYANFKSSVNSFKGKFFMFFVYNIYPLVPAKFKGGFKANFFGGNRKYYNGAIIFECIKEQLLHSKKVLEYLNIKDVDKLQNFRKIQLYNILTLTSAVENLYEGKSSLKKFSDKEFS